MDRLRRYASLSPTAKSLSDIMVVLEKKKEIREPSFLFFSVSVF